MLLRDTTETIRAAAQSTPIVDYATYAPAGTDEALTTRLAPGHDHDPGGLRPGPAGVEGGFGRCLLHAAQALFAQGHDAACVLSSGTPTLGPGVITAATLPLAGSERPVDIIFSACGDPMRACSPSLYGAPTPSRRQHVTARPCSISTSSNCRCGTTSTTLRAPELARDIGRGNSAPWTRRAIDALDLRALAHASSAV